LRNFAKLYPQHAYIRIPELNLACAMAPRKDHSELVEYLGFSLPSVTFSLTVGEMLDELLSRSVTSECSSVKPSTVATLTDAVMENPRYSGSVHYNQFHFMLKARIARVSGNTDETLEYLGRAIELLPSDDLNMMTVTTMVEAGRFDEARSFIEESRKRLPRQPLRRYNSKRYLDDLLTYVNEAGQLARKNSSPSTGE